MHHAFKTGLFTLFTIGWLWRFFWNLPIQSLKNEHLAAVLHVDCTARGFASSCVSTQLFTSSEHCNLKNLTLSSQFSSPHDPAPPFPNHSVFHPESILARDRLWLAPQQWQLVKPTSRPSAAELSLINLSRDLSCIRSNVGQSSSLAELFAYHNLTGRPSLLELEVHFFFTKAFSFFTSDDRLAYTPIFLIILSCSVGVLHHHASPTKRPHHEIRRIRPMATNW